MPRTNIKPLTRTRAKELRSDATRPEQKLWYQLRLLEGKDLHFRRQAPIGPYIADFVSHKEKLVIEVDGATHSTEVEIAHDNRRTEFLNSQGYQVFRCTNDDVMRGLDGLIVEILRLTGRA